MRGRLCTQKWWLPTCAQVVAELDVLHDLHLLDPPLGYGGFAAVFRGASMGLHVGAAAPEQLWVKVIGEPYSMPCKGNGR